MSSDTEVTMLVRSLHRGGLEKMVIELCVQLKRIDYLPRIVCVEEAGVLADSAREQGITVESLEKGPGVSFATIAKLRRQLKMDGTRILHTHNPNGHFYGAMAAATLRRCRVIHSSHQMWMPQKSTQLWLSRISAYFTDHVVGVSEAVRVSACDELKKSSDHTSTIANGLDLKPFLAIPRTDTNCEALRFGTVGRLAEVKNQALLIDAFTRVLKERPKATLALVGDGETRSSLERQVSQAGIADSVNFVGFSDQIHQELAKLDVFVLSSDFEGMPLVIIEAMASGLPIVSTDVGGIGQMVDKSSGLLVPRRNPEALAKAMLSLTDDTQTVRDLGDNARRFADENYQADAMARSYVALYQRLLSA